MTLDIAGVWDIECADWDRFLVGKFLSVDGDSFISWDADTFFDALLEQSGAWYAHVGGRYDGLWFLDMACRRGLDWSATMRGSGVLTAKIGDLEIRDSFALVPMKLAKFAALGGHSKIEVGLPCECGDECGGYCALSRPLSPTEKRRVEDYLHVDCVALLDSLSALEARAIALDITLKLTVGSSAWATAKAWLDLPPCGHDVGRYTKLREGYYGGRTEVIRTQAATGHRFDIHSSYPAALTRVALPIGKGQAYLSSQATTRFNAGLEGIYTADVYVPECDIPPLPARQPDRLLYPHGAFSGTWTAHELRYAVEAGARIDKIHSGYVWASRDRVLAPFAERVWSYRDQYASTGDPADKVFADWIKWLANSCTGKLAQKPEHSSLSFIPSIDGEAPEVDYDLDVVALVYSGVFRQTTRVRVDACAHVQWSAYLTAEARIELHKQLTHAKTPYYCDTDSVYALEYLDRRIGPDLGQWGYEGQCNDWRALAPKVYRYRDEKGKEHVRGKGLSGLDSAGFDALERGEPWTMTKGVEGLKSAVSMGKKLFTRRTLTRTLNPVNGWVGGRELEADGVRTRPTTVERYNAREVIKKHGKPKRRRRSAQSAG